MSWYLYIVRCSDGSYYTGITTDLARRIKMHNTKVGAKSLYGRLPVVLSYFEKYADKIQAAKREREIKGWRRNKKEKLVSKGLP